MKSPGPLLLAITLTLLSFSTRAERPFYRVAVANSSSDHRAPLWLPESLEAVYQYDDGTAEDGLIPLLNGKDDQPEAIFLEQFTVIPGQNVIDSIAVAWGSENGSRPTGLNGQPVTLGIWSDPDNDGQPFDAVLLGWVDGVVSSADTDTFVTYTFNHSVTIPDGSSFFLGFKTPGFRHELAHDRGRFFAGLDTSSSAGKAWLVWNDPDWKVRLRSLGDNSRIFLETTVGGPPGNFMIRSGF